MIEAVTDYAIFQLDANGLVSSWNPGAEKIKGYKAEEIIGRHFSCFYTAEDQKAGTPDKVLDTAKREGRYEAEAWRVRKDGSRLFASVVVDPIRDEEGEVGIAHDFNNLMMIVLGNLDTLKRHTSGLAPNIERNLNNAIRGAQRAASLTSRLLAFSRATARSQAAGRQQIPVRVCGVPTALAR